MISGTLALVTACFFSGAAFYINFAEHPARMTLQPPPLLAQWKFSYKRGFALQATLAILGALSGGYAYHVQPAWQWIAGALLMIANWPFTLFFIMPTNLKLMSTEPAAADSSTCSLLVRWGRLHFVRTCLGCVAACFFFWALARD